MYNNRRKPGKPRYASVCGDLIVRGQPQQIAEKYEAMAEVALKEGDWCRSHIYLNHAEHYRKETQ